jgi:hypothetical protein
MRTNRKRNWLIKRIALGLAIAALAAPVAQASVDEGIPGQPNSPNEVLKAVASRHYDAIEMRRLDARKAGNLAHDVFVVKTGHQSWPGVDPTSVQVYPRYHVSTAVVTSTSSFDWRDAGIGAGLVLALVVLAGGALLASRHVSREQTA